MKKILVIICSLILLFMLSFFCTYKIYRNSQEFSDESLGSTKAQINTEEKNEEAAAMQESSDDESEEDVYESEEEKADYNFLVGELNGYIAVYTNTGSLYEFTDISLDSLESDIRKEIHEGIKFQKAKEMFTFLESCSS